MDKYRELVIEFLKSVQVVTDSANQYAADLKLLGKQVAELNIPTEAFPTPPKIQETKIKPAAILSTFDQLFGIVLDYVKHWERARALLEDYLIYSVLVRMASQTRLHNINAYRKIALEQLTNVGINNLRQQLVDIAAEFLTPTLKTKPSRAPVTAYLMEKKSPFCLALFVALRELFDAEQQEQMAGVVEKRLRELFPEREMPQYLARKYTPLSKSMPWDELMKTYYKGRPPQPDSPQTSGQSVITVEYSTQSAIEFDIKCLTEPTKDTEIIGAAGLSEKTIARYHTITQLPGGFGDYYVRKIPGKSPSMVVESISPGLWRLLAKEANSMDISSRAYEYNSLANINILNAAHKSITHRLSERMPISGSALYDSLVASLVEKFRNKSPATTSHEYFQNATNYNDLIDSIHQTFPHTNMLNLRRESTISYLLRIEPTAKDLIYPEIIKSVEKYMPPNSTFSESSGDNLQSRLIKLYEQSILAAFEVAKNASWLDDYDQTYKICYLHYS